MKEKILALLVAKFAGVRKDGLAQLAGSLSLQAETEEDATALVEKISLEKVNSFVKDWRKDVDKEVSESKKTIEENLKKKYDFVEKKDPEPTDPKPTDPNDIATLVANAVKAAVEPLQQKLSSFEGSKTKEARLQQLQSKFSVFPEGNKIAENFKTQKLKDFGFMNFENDEAFAEYLTGLETDITGLNQEIADAGLSQSSKPFMGSRNTDGISSAVTNFIADKSDDKAKPLTGKEI